jgi:flagellar biosynthesis protein FlhG
MASVTAETKRAQARSPQELVRSILADADKKVLRRVRDKSIAVSSGKGGVGKTITACNLAVYCARRGLRVGLVDLDPLSDVASLLDLHESEQALQEPKSGGSGAEEGFSAIVLPVFRGLEILFPFQKLGAADALDMMDKIYRRFLLEIDRRYDLLLFDMPAGMSYDDNLAYLPFMKKLVLVTNPEPTAHASAGAYVKEVERLYPGTVINLWHNRYSGGLKDGFHPSDVAGNYNRLVDVEDRLSPEEQALLRDFAFIPEDPVLNLLQGEPNPTIHVLKSMKDGLDYVHGRLLSQASRGLGIPKQIRDIVIYYIHRHPKIGQVEEYLTDLGGYLGNIVSAVIEASPETPPGSAKAAAAAEPFSPAERAALGDFLHRIKASALRRDILRLEDLLAETVRRIEESRGAFASGIPMGQDTAVDREVSRFLVTLSRAARRNTLVRNHGALLLFYYSLYKLFQSKTLIRLLHGLVPRKTNRQGRRVRDRFGQIKYLVERDQGYRDRYLKAIKTLWVIVRRQIAAVVDAFDLSDLLLRDGKSGLDGRAYVKLITAFLHEALYSGLSIIVGFDYRSTALAFQDGAERLIASMLPAESGKALP